MTLYRPGDSFSHSLLPGAHGGRSASRPLVSKAFLKCRAREGTASCRCDMGGIDPTLLCSLQTKPGLPEHLPRLCFLLK